MRVVCLFAEKAARRGTGARPVRMDAGFIPPAPCRHPCFSVCKMDVVICCIAIVSVNGITIVMCLARFLQGASHTGNCF